MIRSDGELGWASTWGGQGYDCGNRIAVDPDGYVFIAGEFQKLVDFDPGDGVEEHASNGERDIFLSMFPPDGEW
jgi:hypothetical protein